MLGTLNGALAAREIRLDPDRLTAEVTGTNALIDGIVRLTSIEVHYTMRIPAGTREAVDRALARHREKCPTARSLEAAVTIGWTARIEETD